MKNEYEIRGDITAIILNSRKYGKMETLISTCKLQRANEFPGTWYACRNYVVGNMPKVNGCHNGNAWLHRWITNAPKGMVVDHINSITLDNTDSNLRICTNVENIQNRKGANKTSKSGVRGVSWYKPYKKWRASLQLNKKWYHLGDFDDIEEARIAVESAREKMMPYSKEAYLEMRSGIV